MPVESPPTPALLNLRLLCCIAANAIAANACFVASSTIFREDVPGNHLNCVRFLLRSRYDERVSRRTPLSDALYMGSNNQIRLISEQVRQRVVLCAVERPSTSRVWDVAIEYTGTRNSLVFLDLLLVLINCVQTQTVLAAV